MFTRDSRCNTPEIKFRFAMKKIMITLLFIPAEMKYNFVSGVVGVNRPIKICTQTIGTSMLVCWNMVGGRNAGIYWRSFTLNQHSN